MNLAILHFHLNRGGVAQAIWNHLLALHGLQNGLPGALLLVHGGRRQGFPTNWAECFSKFKIAESVIPGLDYDEGVADGPRPNELAEEIGLALQRFGCSPEDTLLHVHNHGLGKNLSLPGALKQLAVMGYGLLLQVHDFVEDFRPANYRRMQVAFAARNPQHLSEILYPQSPHIHYAVLNGRDLAILLNAGVHSSRLHLLPNAVLPLYEHVARNSAREQLAQRFGVGCQERYVLSPVRGIRRKNLGEVLLWSAAAPPETAFGLTLPPLNPAEQTRYAFWKSLAQQLNLRCLFEVGGDSGLVLAENFAACDRILTTSVAEGFGFAFLEPNLAGRVVIGRDLPEITADFVAEGLTFGWLRERMQIPKVWIDRDWLQEGYAQSFNSTLQAYGRTPLNCSELRAGIDAKVQEDCFDFAALTVDLQASVLRRVAGNRYDKEVLLEKNPWITESICSDNDVSQCEVIRNDNIIRQSYSLSQSGARLASIYHQITKVDRIMSNDRLKYGDRMVSDFVNLNRFHPVRV